MSNDTSGTATPAQQRAAYVGGLKNELAALERQPEPNEARIAGVKAQLDKFSREPAQPSTEVAIPGAVGGPVGAVAAPGPASTQKPAKKAAAKKAAAKKAPAKKAAPKSGK